MNTEARDDTTSLALLRRPVNKASLSAILVADRQNDRDHDVLICEPLGRRRSLNIRAHRPTRLMSWRGWPLNIRLPIIGPCSPHREFVHNTRIRRAFFVPYLWRSPPRCRRIVLGETANLDQSRGGNVNKPDDQPDLLAGHLSDAETAWSIGSFGAIAEFMRDADEDVVLDRVGGAIAAPRAGACGSLRTRRCGRSLRNR